MTKAVISYELNSEAKGLFAHSVSSDDYSNLIQSILIPCDLAFTYGFRWGRVYDYDLPDSEGRSTNGQGPMIDYVMAHPAAGVSFIVGIVLVSAVCTYVEYDRQQKLKNNSDSKFIFNKLLGECKQDPNPLTVLDLNNYLELVLSEDDELKAKIERLELTPDGSELKVTLHDVVKPVKQSAFRKFNSKFLQPLWVALNLSSFTYWILWISFGIFTGSFAIGVAGCSPIIAFGLPILSGMIYPALKVYNHYKNKKTGKRAEPVEAGEILDPKVARETYKANEKFVCSLLRKALLRKMHNAKIILLSEECKKIGIEPPAAVVRTQATYMDDTIIALKKNKKIKSAVAFFAALFGTFVAAQYAAWIVLDLLNTAMSITLGIDANIILGVVLMAVACVAAAAAAISRFNQVKDFNNVKLNPMPDADVVLTQELIDKLGKLKAKILADEKAYGEAIPDVGSPLVHFADDQFFKDIDRRGPTKTTLIKKGFSRLYQFINGACTGVFIGRLFLIKGSAIALPFAALSLSTPVTIILVVAIGLIYGAFKVYEYHQSRKEARAEQMFRQRAERIDCLYQQIELAELRAKIVSAKLAERNAAPLAAPVELGSVIQHGMFANDLPIEVQLAPSPTHALQFSA